MDPRAHADFFRDAAKGLGFARVGFTPVGAVERHRLYREWIARGYGADMAYLERDAEARRDPGLLLADARTVVTVALAYAERDAGVPAERLTRGAHGTVARYARGDDYHVVMKRKLHRLAKEVAARLGRPMIYRACVDTAPLLEREAAHASGIGFIAKNTMLIAPGLGSYVLLGELVTDVECEPGAATEPRCGECRACLDACPTGAFVDAYTLDARRCISYLTIEHTGSIPRQLRPLIGDRVFGCDVCQEVCPFNAAEHPGAPELEPRPGRGRPLLVHLLGLGAAQFRKWQKGSALRRIHRRQLRRNACVALGNVGTVSELDALARALDDPWPLVRAHAAWAIGRIGAREPAARERTLALLGERREVEDDPEVLEELAAALRAD